MDRTKIRRPRLVQENCKCTRSVKLRWQWKIPIHLFLEKIPSKWLMFHCHLSLPECITIFHPLSDVVTLANETPAKKDSHGKGWKAFKAIHMTSLKKHH